MTGEVEGVLLFLRNSLPPLGYASHITNIVCMNLLCEKHWELVRANEILSANIRKKFFYTICPGKVGICLLCEKH